MFPVSMSIFKAKLIFLFALLAAIYAFYTIVTGSKNEIHLSPSKVDWGE